MGISAKPGFGGNYAKNAEVEKPLYLNLIIIIIGLPVIYPESCYLITTLIPWFVYSYKLDNVLLDIISFLPGWNLGISLIKFLMIIMLSVCPQIGNLPYIIDWWIYSCLGNLIMAPVSFILTYMTHQSIKIDQELGNQQ